MKLVLRGSGASDVAPQTGPNVLGEARLDVIGGEASPNDLISTPLLPGRSAQFNWSLTPAQAGKVEGTLWIYLDTVTQDSGNDEPFPLAALPVEVDVVSLLGLSTSTLQIVGVLGAAAGLVLTLPWVGNRLARRKSKRRPHRTR